METAGGVRGWRGVGYGDLSAADEVCERSRAQPLISRQDAPSRYRIGCIARRSALPRERFSPLTPNGPTGPVG
jgi:hypothetical protein